MFQTKIIICVLILSFAVCDLRTLLQDNCTSDADCGNGTCLNSIPRDCACNKGFVTKTDNTVNTSYCGYEQKKQFNAFILELIVGFGAGNFYSKRTVHAVLKLIAFVFGLYLICLFPLSAKYINDKYESDCCVLMVSCMYYFCSAGLAFWYIYDLVNFGMNRYKDGNNIDLLNWG